MKQLKKVHIIVTHWLFDGTGNQKRVNDMLKKNLPHLSIIGSKEYEANFDNPAHPYGKHDRRSGFWEKSCNQPSMFPNKPEPVFESESE